MRWITLLVAFFSLVLIDNIACANRLEKHSTANGRRLTIHGKNGLKTVAVDRNRRRLAWEDKDLPLPHTIHELGQHSKRTHEFHGIRRLDDANTTAPAAPSGPRDAEVTPLYPGYGTHFSYVYVGTPPQRQSVIIDAGSHYTAFPCIGCSQCGQHTDNYWDMKNSSTVNVPKCNNAPCVISQSYSEGSSWKAIKVVDKLWVGGLTPSVVQDAGDYAVDFLFGCQTSETGLFRTQLADGIMGMSMDDDTLPFQLFNQKVVDTRVFALCFRVGGGIMTLGGVEQRIHSKPGIVYAKLNNRSGWFQINLLDISLVDQSVQNPDSNEKKSLGFPESAYLEGKGTIVDSGTTDTYFPQKFADKFSQIFKDISGIKFTSGNIQLSTEQLMKMPNLVLKFEGVDGKPFSLIMPWINYVDNVGGGKYAFRIYLTEGSGVVLGANFMDGMNVIFDVDNGRVGFAKSTCKYEEFDSPKTLSPTPLPTRKPRPTKSPSSPDAGGDEIITDECKSDLVPQTQCTAECEAPTGAYYAVGNQTFTDPCQPQTGVTISKYCHVPCVGIKPVRGDPNCPEKAWTECNRACIQSRMVPAILSRRLSGSAHHGHEHVHDHAHDYAEMRNYYRRHLDGEDPNSAAGGASNGCKMTQQTRVCYTGACPVADGDYLIFIDLRVFIPPQHWSYVHSEAFFGALSKMFGVKESSIELLNDASSEYTLGVKLHFQMRLKAKDYSTVQNLHSAAQYIPETVWEPDFKGNLISALEAVSKKNDKIDYSRFGYLESRDIEVLNAMALPIGDVRDPVEIPEDANGAVVINHIKDYMGSSEKFELLLLGVLVMCILCLCCVLCMHMRLRQEHAALEKDKVIPGSLRKMWNRFIKQERQRSAQKYSRVELTEQDANEAEQGLKTGAKTTVPFSAEADADDELDDEDVGDD